MPAAVSNYLQSRHLLTYISVLCVIFTITISTRVVHAESMRLTVKERKELIDAHNHFRKIVQPKAQKMPKLEWDFALEDIAQQYVDRCVGGHNPDRSKDYPVYVGENIYSGSAKSLVMNMTRAVELWDSEKKDYDYASNSCRGVCGHYTQVVWADTTKLGCGRANCPGLGFPYNIVCNYAKGGNYAGVRPYELKTSGAASATSHTNLFNNRRQLMSTTMAYLLLAVVMSSMLVL